MCLTIPKKVVAVKKNSVRVKSPKGMEETGTIVKVKKNDWVLTQGGIIIRRITENQAKEINNLLK